MLNLFNICNYLETHGSFLIELVVSPGPLTEVAPVRPLVVLLVLPVRPLVLGGVHLRGRQSGEGHAPTPLVQVGGVP